MRPVPLTPLARRVSLFSCLAVALILAGCGDDDAREQVRQDADQDEKPAYMAQQEGAPAAAQNQTAGAITTKKENGNVILTQDFQGGLRVTGTMPETIAANRRIPYKITFTNTTDQPLLNVTARLSGTDKFELGQMKPQASMNEQNQPVWHLGEIGANQSKTTAVQDNPGMVSRPAS